MSWTPPLAGRVALVTGASRGIGAASARALATAGADVAVHYRNRLDAATETVRAVEAAGRRAVPVGADVNDPVALDAMTDTVERELGAVDLLVSNAGGPSPTMAVTDTEPSVVEDLWRTHALAAFHLCRRLVPAMRAAPRADIVLVSSVATTLLPPFGAPYTMAKAALEALARTLAKEERVHGTRVHVVAPGLVDTDMGRRVVESSAGVCIEELDVRSPFGHVCRPEDVADVVRFLVTTSYINDQRIVIDGGTF